MQNGIVKLEFLPEIGGRISSLTLDGEELLFLDHKAVKNFKKIDTVKDVHAYKKTMDFPITGGDKTWLAPQSAWAEGKPPLDLDSGEYRVLSKSESAISMLSPVCRETGMRICRDVKFSGDKIILTETLENCSDKKQKWSIWNVTQILRPFVAKFHIKERNLRAYDFSTSKEYRSKLVKQNKDWTDIDVNNAGEFKFGGIADKGVILLERKIGDKKICWKRNFDVHFAAKYAHDSNVEIYNSSNDDNPYFEIEVHAPVRELKPGEKQSLIQYWEFSV